MMHTSYCSTRFLFYGRREKPPSATEYHHKRLSSSQLESPLQKVLAEKRKKEKHEKLT
jgi:hypothetical protein